MLQTFFKFFLIFAHQQFFGIGILNVDSLLFYLDLLFLYFHLCLSVIPAGPLALAWNSQRGISIPLMSSLFPWEAGKIKNLVSRQLRLCDYELNMTAKTVCMHVHGPFESVEWRLCLSGVRKSEIYIILCHNSSRRRSFLKEIKEP